MSKLVTVRGNAKTIKLYNLSVVDTIEMPNYDLSVQEDINELLTLANEMVESGEIDALTPPIELNILELEDAQLEIDEEAHDIESITLKNKALEDILEELQDAELGDIYYIYSLEGEGNWDIEVDSEDFTPSELKLSYIDCASYFDQFDILREGYLELLCDSVIPEELSLDNVSCELKDFYLDPTQEYGELYKVVKSDGAKVLERIPNSGRVLAGTECNVDDLLEN